MTDRGDAQKAFVERQADFQPEVIEGDYTTRDEALAVLRQYGVEAWRQWCRDHAPSV